MIRNAILLVLVNALALYVTMQVLPNDFIVTGGPTGLIIAGLIFGIMNSVVKPILKMLSLPFVFLTAGLFIIVINAVVLWLTKYALGILAIPDVAISINNGYLTWLYAIVILSVVNIVMHWLVKRD